MSDRCGSAKRDGVSVALTTAPDLGDGPVNELDYIPGITKGKDIDQSS